MSAQERLAAAMQRIDASVAARRAEAAHNRARAPICTAFVDDMRAEFGPGVVVTYVSEGELAVGKPDERAAVDGGEITVRDDKGGERVVARWTRLGVYDETGGRPRA